jgi:hypothetical protein
MKPFHIYCFLSIQPNVLFKKNDKKQVGLNFSLIVQYAEQITQFFV